MKSIKKQRRRSGFSLRDVIVVLAIVLVIIAMFFPAVRQAREAARRAQCKCHLKQIGVALNNYHHTHKSFPAGFELASDGPYTGWGWGVRILPFLDQNATYEKFDFSRGLSGEQNQLSTGFEFDTFGCPSDPAQKAPVNFAIVSSDVHDGEVVSAKADSAKRLVRSTYFAVAGYLSAAQGGIERTDAGDSPDNPGRLGNRGISFVLENQYCDQHNFRGMFGQNSFLRTEDLKDGTSNTIMVGERRSPFKVGNGEVGQGTWLGVPDCSTTEGLAAVVGDTSVKLNLGGARPRETTGFGSFHKGGAYFLMADESVRFLSENLSITTYRDLSTIDDGQQIGEY